MTRELVPLSWLVFRRMGNLGPAEIVLVLIMGGLCVAGVAAVVVLLVALTRRRR
jgi:hypothetical protein